MRKTSKQLTACILTAALALTTSLGQAAPTTTAATATLTSDPDRASVHDPSIAVSKDGKTYYAFGSHITAAKSTDMVNWDTFTNGYAATNNKLFGNLDTNLEKPFSWAGKDDVDSSGGYSVWAPDVFWNDKYKNEDGTTGAYMMYFCTTSTWKRSVIAYGVSQNIEGPYTVIDNIVYSDFTPYEQYDKNSKINKCYTNTNIPELIKQGILQDGTDGISENWFKGLSYNHFVCPNALDPTVFEDKDGKLWMTYGSWSGGIYVLEIDPETGKAIYPGKSQKSNANGLLVDEYFGVQVAGGEPNGTSGNPRSGEGPYILYDKDSDYYYLYVSYDGLDAYNGYNMRLFRSKNPDGPYLDASGKSATLSATGDHDKIGVRVMGGYTFSCLQTQSDTLNAYIAQGHNSALIDSDGERYLIYHTRFDDGMGWNHQIRVHQQFINEEGWPVTAVFENKGDRISKTGYEKDDIVGTYEYINHGLAPDFIESKEPETITLNSNNTITGAVKGTWSMKDGTYYMSITIGSVKYSGVFYKQHDEGYGNSMKEVMTFTAIGTNNETIWGAKKEPALKASAGTLYVGGNTGKTGTVSVINCVGSYSVSYTSSKPSVASVSSTGKVTAKKAGTTTITAKIKIGNVTKTATKKITVKKASIKFSAKKSSLKVGKSYTFKAKGTGIKASSIKFSSSKPKILKITSKGKAKALKKGTATITAKYNKIKVTCKVKVKK